MIIKFKIFEMSNNKEIIKISNFEKRIRNGEYIDIDNILIELPNGNIITWNEYVNNNLHLKYSTQNINHNKSPMGKENTPVPKGIGSEKRRKRYWEEMYENKEDSKGKFTNVNYKIFHQDWKEKPLTLITDFKIHKSEGNYIEVIGKGYEYKNLSAVDKQGWIPFDDYKTKNVRKFPKKAVQDGKKRIKVYFNDN